MTLAAPAPFDAPRIRRLRERLNVSQPVFAAALNVSPATVKAWERGHRRPHGAALRLLAIAERHPAVVAEAIRRESARSA